MKKIPTVFKRDSQTKLVVEEVTPGCEWVLQGRGDATFKWDGSACLVDGGKLYKRYDAKKGRAAPEGFIAAQDPDPLTGHWPGWIPVGDGPEDEYHREAFAPIHDAGAFDGTYELVGPKINGNPHNIHPHVLIPHGKHPLHHAPSDYVGLMQFLRAFDGEGIVFHHPDGKMAKIKKRDFGYRWGGSK